MLLRAARVVGGHETVETRRPGIPAERTARGPGNLGRTLGVTRADDGTVLGSGGIELVPGAAPAGVRAGVRVNVSRAFARPWRFWDAGSASVSAAKLHPAARAAAPRQPSG